MKKNLIFLLLFLSGLLGVSAQRVALKNNLLYDATLTPNLALEIGVGPKMTVDLLGGVNPFKISDDHYWKHWLAQPELRYWFCEKFNGVFIGLHGHVGQMNIAGISVPPVGSIHPKSDFDDAKYHRYQGWFYGGGISIGRQWILGNHWNLEASIGGGYIHFDYDKYQCVECGKKVGVDKKADYFGLTRATLSLIYLFK
ncbi:DUF3575 domain-containing protein [Porphyromonas gingivalis]|uniref:DUF3575 domain-containing protein n=1 Tax=Porphyromonas gingivalis (strain ATCC 33277 / DSM 20709 / CIP 103683 / JCM 12257 / NCTC 11834 / 2561) TaxID=431947 RepID=B2RH03_PORG3|nr:DUF3575 domain-containing protein [Porphyromonas gingivalis]AIJ35001.1 hypothetical protein EG14_02620 [Porphyromonas gingivalis]ALJ24616.1 Protein of unknown function (DUF3575) [Porphyromonas gingivalis 381]ATR90580.1 DUF3575 domain-containing protein [Porphyromonas gingivalis]ATR93363.1 DUF3575 domain-containing protein [Porphyromonas gingivalis]ATR99281.1 DUF3575 domain-containing protein [Porphyromonas gingivalis]